MGHFPTRQTHFQPGSSCFPPQPVPGASCAAHCCCCWAPQGAHPNLLGTVRLSFAFSIPLILLLINPQTKCRFKKRINYPVCTIKAPLERLLWHRSRIAAELQLSVIELYKGHQPCRQLSRLRTKITPGQQTVENPQPCSIPLLPGPRTGFCQGGMSPGRGAARRGHLAGKESQSS